MPTPNDAPMSDYEREPITREFTDYLCRAMRIEPEWEKCLSPGRIRRTEAGLRHLVRSLDNQIAQHGGPGSPGFNADWLQRTKALRETAKNHINQIERLVDTRIIARKDYSRMVEESVRLKDFAWNLAVELEKIGASGIAALHDVPSPRGDITAFEWMERRHQAILRQEAAEAAEAAEGRSA